MDVDAPLAVRRRAGLALIGVGSLVAVATVAASTLLGPGLGTLGDLAREGVSTVDARVLSPVTAGRVDQITKDVVSASVMLAATDKQDPATQARLTEWSAALLDDDEAQLDAGIDGVPTEESAAAAQAIRPLAQRLRTVVECQQGGKSDCLSAAEGQSLAAMSQQAGAAVAALRPYGTMTVAQVRQFADAEAQRLTVELASPSPAG